MDSQFKSILRTAILITGIASASAASGLTLPAVSNCGYGGSYANLLCYSPTPGVNIYIASQHDNFISYSANAMKQLGTTFGYTGLSEWGSLPVFGSGQIVKLFSFNNSNNGTFPNATSGTNDNNSAPNADLTPTHDGLYQGNWPVPGPVTVGNLLSYITGTSPVFTFDLNEPGSGLSLNGRLQIMRGSTVIDTFAFDNTFNSAYDPNSFVTAPSDITVTWYDASNPACDAITHICTMQESNNVGSGKPDFFAYAPTLDLNNYLATDTVSFYLSMNGISAGGEELAFTNIVTTPNVVPEPGVLALMGLGFLSLGFARHRKSVNLS